MRHLQFWVDHLAGIWTASSHVDLVEEDSGLLAVVLTEVFNEEAHLAAVERPCFDV